MHKSSCARPFTPKGCPWHRCTHLPHYLFTQEDAFGNPVLSFDHPALLRAVVRVRTNLSDSRRPRCSSPRSFQEAPCRPSTSGTRWACPPGAALSARKTLGLAVMIFLQAIRIVSTCFAHHLDVLTGGPVHTPTLLRMRDVQAVARTRHLLRHQ